MDREYLECPCCGDVGAWASTEGLFMDEQALTCGCPGLVSVDEDGDVWINNGDEPCKKCDPPPADARET